MLGFTLRQSRNTATLRNCLLYLPAAASRNSRTRRANAVGTYRERQRQRVELGVGTLSDCAWYGTEYEWQRARALAHAGHEGFI